MVGSYCVSSPGEAFHAIASAAVTAGDLVKSTSSDDVMTAISSAGFVESEVKVATAGSADDAIIVGVALNDAAINGTVSVMTQGLFIIKSGAAVTTGALIGQETTPQEVEDATVFNNVIGRALTGASGSGKYVLARLI